MPDIGDVEDLEKDTDFMFGFGVIRHYQNTLSLTYNKYLIELKKKHRVKIAGNRKERLEKDINTFTQPLIYPSFH